MGGLFFCTTIFLYELLISPSGLLIIPYLTTYLSRPSFLIPTRSLHELAFTGNHIHNRQQSINHLHCSSRQSCKEPRAHGVQMSIPNMYDLNHYQQPTCKLTITRPYRAVAHSLQLLYSNVYQLHYLYRTLQNNTKQLKKHSIPRQASICQSR